MALALGLITADAGALTLGRLNVQSALGEPLRAEIELADITASEADGLRLNVASADAFRLAGVPYNAALSDVRVNLQRRADGRYVVRLTGGRSLNEPFIDLLLEANWSSGRIVRDYTLLLDPPSSAARPAIAIAPTAPQISLPPQRVLPAESAAARRAPRPAVAQAPAEPPPVRTGEGERVTVQTGDTAGKIASAYKPADISLDQMLVALLRANPDAFIGGNINRMKAGAVLDMPSASQAAATPPAEARRTVAAQSRDFGDYRRRLAENAPASRMAGADRQASGKLQANVEDRNAAAAPADRLTIARGNATTRAAEDKLAQSRQAQESNARVAELSKNISELNKLQAASGGATPSTPATAASAAPAAAVAPSAAPATAPAATTPATAAPSGTPAAPAAAVPAAPAAMTPATGASAVPSTVPSSASPSTPATPVAAAASAAVPAVPVAPPKPAPKAATPPPPPEPGFFDDLLANPILLAAIAIALLLIGFLFYRRRNQKRQDAGESVFLESRLPKDSFFGATGGESVDTKNRNSGNSGVSSLSYSPSQLDAGDVDPVAEADVYLAYGRDLQAEEILREALRLNPERIAIHLKLLEIHAKRRDLRAYEALAADVHKLTGGTGNDWNRVVDMGKDLDPGNPLYEAGMRSSAADVTLPFTAGAAAAAVAAGAVASVAPAPAPVSVAPPPVIAPPPAFVPSVAPLDFDLDMSIPPITAPAPLSASLPPIPSSVPVIDMPPAAPPLNPLIDLENDFDTAPGALDPLTRPIPMPGSAATHQATLRGTLPGDSGFIEFDMSAMADLAHRAPAETERDLIEPADDGEGPHAIKLSLARELQALGDTEGARSLVEEVEAESTGDVKAEARLLLSQLS